MESSAARGGSTRRSGQGEDGCRRVTHDERRPALSRPMALSGLRGLVLGALIFLGLGGAGLSAATAAVAQSSPQTTQQPAASFWLASSSGGVWAFGNAPALGSLAGVPLAKPIVGMTPTHNAAGYWLVASDGGIFSYGNATFFGSTGGIRLNQPIVGMASTPDDRGYWLVALRRRHLLLRRRQLLRLHGFHPAESADRRHGVHAHGSRLLAGGLRRRASSPSATPSSKVRRDPSVSTSPSLA